MVTIVSIFGDGGGSSARRRRQAGGQGSGLRDLRRRRDRSPTPTSSPTRDDRAAGARSTRPRRSTSSSPTATRSRPTIVGFDPFADVALLKVDPDGLDLHPLELGADGDVARRRAGRGDRQPVRRGAVALGRRRLGHRPLDRVADRLPDRRRDPDRRLDQPRQLGRPAARRRRRGDRHQPADPDRRRAATRASASRSRSTSPSARSTSCATTARSPTPTSASPRQPLYPQLADRLGLDADTGAPGLRGRRRTGPPTTPACRRATSRSASRAARSTPAAT